MIPLKSKKVPRFDVIKDYMDKNFDKSKDSIEDMKSLVKWISEVKLAETVSDDNDDEDDKDATTEPGAEPKPESSGRVEPSKHKSKVNIGPPHYMKIFSLSFEALSLSVSITVSYSIE